MGLFGGRRGRQLIEVGGASHVGGRADNQDRCAVGSSWAVVSDGAGGHAGGARAAELAVTTAAAALADRRAVTAADGLRAIIERANRAVLDERRRDPAVATMAATVTIAVALDVDEDRSRWLVANLGDSPAWHVRPADVEQLTRDHNVAGELQRTGVLTVEEARTHPGRYRITRSLGSGAEVDPDVHTVDLPAGDALVLGTDGLDVLAPDELAAVVRRAASAREAAEALVAVAVERRTADNVTAVVLRHVPSPGDAPPRH